MAGNWGGKRENAGRKSRTERFGSQIVAAEARLADQLPRIVARILALGAAKGPPKVEEKFARACTLTRKDVVRDHDGKPLMDGKNRLTPIEVPMFPKAAEDDEVLVERKVTTQGFDLTALMYAVDRILGKTAPTDDAPVDPDPLQGLPYDLTMLPDADYDQLTQILSRAVPRGPSDGGGPGSDDGRAGGGAAAGPA